MQLTGNKSPDSSHSNYGDYQWWSVGYGIPQFGNTFFHPLEIDSNFTLETELFHLEEPFSTFSENRKNPLQW